MSHRTVVLSSYQAYLASEVQSAEEDQLRNKRLARFPFSVVLELSYPELDFANRWCWLNFGPCDGECLQRFSEYPVCRLAEPHQHAGRWTSYWLAKTEYNFGFNEWYFHDRADHDQFLANVENINFGEKFK